MHMHPKEILISMTIYTLHTCVIEKTAAQSPVIRKTKKNLESCLVEYFVILDGLTFMACLIIVQNIHPVIYFNKQNKFSLGVSRLASKPVCFGFNSCVQ